MKIKLLGVILFILAFGSFTPASYGQTLTFNGTVFPTCPGVPGILRAQGTCPWGVLTSTIEVRDAVSGGLVANNTQPGWAVPMNTATQGRLRVLLICNSLIRQNIAFDLVAEGSSGIRVALASDATQTNINSFCNDTGRALNLIAPPLATGSTATVQWTGPGTMTNGGTTSTVTVTNVPNGNNTYTYTLRRPGCNDFVQTATVQAIATPRLAAVTDISVCQGATSPAINFTEVNSIAGTTFSWINNRTSIGLAANGTGNIAPFTPTNSGTAPIVATITVTPTNNGCTGTDATFTITAQPTVTVTATATRTTYCAGFPISITATSNVATTFNWTGATSETTAFTATGATMTRTNCTIPMAGTYTVEASIGTCTRSTTVNIGVVGAPTLTVTNQTTCAPNTVDLSASGVATASAGSTISYWVDAAATTALTNFTSVATSGDYYIRATGTACAIVARIRVTINSGPTFTVTAPTNSPCEPGTIDISSTVSNATGLTMTYWEDATANTTPFALTSGSPIYKTAGSKTIYIKGTTATGGCATIQSVTVNINPKPRLTITAPTPPCHPQNTASTPTTRTAATVNLTAPSIYTGSTPTGLNMLYFTNSTATNQITATAASAITAGLPNNVPPIAGDLTLSADGKTYSRTFYVTGTKVNSTATDITRGPDCVSDITPITVTVNNRPITSRNIVAATDTTMCGGNTFNLTSVAKADLAGATFTYSTSRTITPAITNTNVGAGTYFFRATSDTGCAALNVQPITITNNDNPTLNTQDKNVCWPTTVTLNEMVTGTNGTVTYSVRGSIAGISGTRPGNFVYDRSNDSFQKTTNSSIVVDMTSTITYTITRNTNDPRTGPSDQNVCTSTNARTITVKPIPSIDINPGPILCKNGTVRIVFKDKGGYSPAITNPNTLVTWTAFESNATSVENVPTTNFVSGEANQFALTASPATQNVSLTTSAPNNRFSYLTYLVTPWLNGCSGVIDNQTVTTGYDATGNPITTIKDNKATRPIVLVKIAPQTGPEFGSNTFDLCSGNDTQVPLQALGGATGVYFSWDAVANRRVFGSSSRIWRDATSVPAPPAPNNLFAGGPGINLVQTLTTLNAADSLVRYTVSPYIGVYVDPDPLSPTFGEPTGDKTCGTANTTTTAICTNYCQGVAGTATVIVHPIPIADAQPDKLICSGQKVNVKMTTQSLQGTDLTTPAPANAPMRRQTKYYRVSTVNSGTVSGTNDFPRPTPPAFLPAPTDSLVNDVLTNSGAVDAVLTYTLTPVTGYSAARSFGGCFGTPRTFNVTVKNIVPPSIDQVLDNTGTTAVPVNLSTGLSICEALSDPGTPNNVNLSFNSSGGNTSSPYTYTWTVANNTWTDSFGVVRTYTEGFDPQTTSGVSSSIQQAVRVVRFTFPYFGYYAGTTTFYWYDNVNLKYTVTPWNSGCYGNDVTIPVLLKPKPRIASVTPRSSSLCNNKEGLVDINAYTYGGDANNITYTWTSTGATNYVGNTDKMTTGTTSPVTIKAHFTDKSEKDIVYTFKPYHTVRQCYGDTYTEVNNNFGTGKTSGNRNENTVTMKTFPYPTVVADNSSLAFCDGGYTNVKLSSAVAPADVIAGTTYEWRYDASAPSDLYGYYNSRSTVDQDVYKPDGTTNPSGKVRDFIYPATTDYSVGPIQQKLTLGNGVTTPRSITYNIIPQVSGCVGDTIRTVVNVYPKPTLTISNNSSVICSNNTTSISLAGTTGSVTTTKYTWTTSTSGVVGSSVASTAQLGPINQKLSTVAGSTLAGSVTYRIKPVYQFTDASCFGDEQTTTVTVNPLPTATLTPNSKTLCSGDQLKVNFESNLATATNTFTYTISPVGSLGGQGTDQTTGFASGERTIGNIINNVASVQDLTFVVTPSAKMTATDPACQGSVAYLKIPVLPVVSMQQPESPTPLCSGDNTYISLSSNQSDTYYAWTASSTVSSVAVTGQQNEVQSTKWRQPINQVLNVPPTSTTNGTVRYVITPWLDYENTYVTPSETKSCSGSTKTVDQDVRPSPTLTDIPSLQVCSLTPVPAITFTSNTDATNTTYTWSNDNATTGLNQNGTGSIEAFTAGVNALSRDLVSNVTVQPYYRGCPGKAKRFKFTVYSSPDLAVSPADGLAICSGVPTIDLSVPNGMTGVNYYWEVSASNVDGASDLTKDLAVGFFATGALSPTTALPGSAIYTFHAVAANGCSSEPKSLTVIVNPTPTVEAIVADAELCPDEDPLIQFDLLPTNGVLIPAKYTWKVSMTNMTGATNESTPQSVSSITPDVSLIDQTKPGTLTYTITPEAYGCKGPDFLADVSMRVGRLAAPDADPVSTSYCENATIKLESATTQDVNTIWYNSADGSAASWHAISDNSTYAGTQTKSLTISNVPASFHNYQYRLRLQDKVCPNTYSESKVATLTELLHDVSIKSTSALTIAAGNSITYAYSGVTDGVDYQWDFGDGWTSTERNPIHFYYTKGKYDTKLKVTQGSCFKNLLISPVQITGPDDWGQVYTKDPSSLTKGVQVFPVPALSDLTILSEYKIQQLDVTDAQGRLKEQTEPNDFRTQLPVESYTPGVYILTVKHEKGVERIKWIKQ